MDQKSERRGGEGTDRCATAAPVSGNAGDAKPVGVSELRIAYGPGYRVYFVKRGDVLVILLCGGDKRTQDGDITRAKAMAEGLKNAP